VVGGSVSGMTKRACRTYQDLHSPNAGPGNDAGKLGGGTKTNYLVLCEACRVEPPLLYLTALRVPY
jgi:hypothetical protein